MLSTLFFIVILIAGLIVIALIGSGIFWFLVQIGVIVQKAAEPPTQDYGSYSLDQGRDVDERER
ncbi:hypothetical protein QTO31_03895 [Chloroflexus sp. MS-CIW-1]|jgi:hypothetical protein|uniref:hypothetical protein n=1 Tax=unclassified Chloroflexus TaxID=2633855 RepID=UPI0004DFB292|nr:MULTISPECIES: hypothetical protein [unclassified Chloroflexus]MBO9347208.1 hypothetical protein [Chloroflexus sp.]MDN5271106.1 hypothetical protein [Chloroflexus sp. MS-CIW-1]